MPPEFGRADDIGRGERKAPQPVSSRFGLNTQVRQRPIIIGLYGLPGSGKSTLLNQLKLQLGHDGFNFYEGSEKIAALVPGGLEAFQKLKEQDKIVWRQLAIDEIGKESVQNNRIAVVTGHFMFWPEAEPIGHQVHTANDLNTFTHITYLDVPVNTIASRRRDDKQRKRPDVSTEHLRKWQNAEIAEIRRLCRLHAILFTLILNQSDVLNSVLTMIQHFRRAATEPNWARVNTRLDEILSVGNQLQTVLVMDADKTLAAEDTGTMFWEALANSGRWTGQGSPLRELFSGPLGYSETAFLQATLLYEETTNEEEFENNCNIVASSVKMHRDFIALLRLVAGQQHIRTVVVTCGIRRIWEKVLEREHLSETVKVIGGGRILDGFVVTAQVKADVVARLRHVEHLHVVAFGDSPLDLPMLEAADEAIIITGEERTRSRSMDALLSKAIDDRGLKARQALLPDHVSPRLDETRLPQVRLIDLEFVESVIRCRGKRRYYGTSYDRRILHATEKNAAKLLMSPTRDASVAGPVLRKAHHQVGKYLAMEFVSKLIGVEEYPMTHVQGHQTSGFRLRHEHQTSIVALMRGGEAMAFGVNEVFPRAMFVHAATPTDIQSRHLQNQRTVILVDSVVNSGKTLLQFIEHVRLLHNDICILVIAGVVQTGAIAEGQALTRLMTQSGASLIALRLSENKFTGTKNTDTGNRLCNTTHFI